LGVCQKVHYFSRRWFTEYLQLLLLAQKDVIPAETVKLISVLMTFMSADGKVSVHAVFHPLAQKLKARAELIDRKAVVFLAHVVIEVSADDVVDPRENGSATDSEVTCEFAVVKNVAAQI
jgi:hypothetical protein